MAGTILAAAGLSRLGRSEVTGFAFAFDEMLPAVGQGALAIEARADHPRLSELKAALDHRPTALAVSAERALLGTLEGGCQVPIAAHAHLEGGRRGRRGHAGARRLRGLAGRRPLPCAARALGLADDPRGARDLPRRRAARARRRRDPGRDPHAVSPAGPDTARLAGPAARRPHRRRDPAAGSRRPRSSSLSRRSAPRCCWRRPSASSRDRWTTRSRPPCASSRPTSWSCSRAPTPCASSPATSRAARTTAACPPGPSWPPSARRRPPRSRSTASPVTSSPTSTSPRACWTPSRSRPRPSPAPASSSPAPATPATCFPRRCASAAPGRRAPHLRHGGRRRARRAGGAGGVGRLHHLHVGQHRAAAGGAAARPSGAGRPLPERLAGVRLCSIGPVTSRALRELGLAVAVEARDYTAAGLVAAIEEDARSR